MARSFGRRLKELRTAAGLSQGDLGDLVGLTRQAISFLELGEREPSWETVRLLASALGVTVAAFDVNDVKPRKRKRE